MEKKQRMKSRLVKMSESSKQGFAPKKSLAPRNLNLPAEGFARLPQVLYALGICKSSLFAGIQKGIYPKPIRIGTRTSVWPVNDIRKLIQKLSASNESSNG